MVVGDLNTNCYIIKQDDTRAAVVIDPGDETEKILSALEEKDCALEKILLTHGHFDHTGAVSDLAEKNRSKGLYPQR